jgi:hypothetical protein
MHPMEQDDDTALQVEAEMPRYVSHKQVWALEIDTVTEPGFPTANSPAPGWKLTFRDKGYAPVKAEPEMFARYVPVPGDFYVQYADGYKSFSPRKAFLEGYKAVKV